MYGIADESLMISWFESVGVFSLNHFRGFALRKFSDFFINRSWRSVAFSALREVGSDDPAMLKHRKQRWENSHCDTASSGGRKRSCSQCGL